VVLALTTCSDSESGESFGATGEPDCPASMAASDLASLASAEVAQHDHQRPNDFLIFSVIFLACFGMISGRFKLT